MWCGSNAKKNGSVASCLFTLWTSPACIIHVPHRAPAEHAHGDVGLQHAQGVMPAWHCCWCTCSICCQTSAAESPQEPGSLLPVSENWGHTETETPSDSWAAMARVEGPPTRGDLRPIHKGYTKHNETLKPKP